MSSESDGSVVVSKEVVWEFETGDITWLEWHPGANVLFATTDGSELWMWKIPSGDSKVYLGNGEKAEGAVIMPGDFILFCLENAENAEQAAALQNETCCVVDR